MAQDFAQARMRELDHKKLESGIAAIGVLGGLTQVLIPSPTLPPATNTNAFYYGDSEKILVDPSPKDEQTLEYLFEWMDQNPVHTIFLTHHHGDHLKNVDQILARFPRIDIALSQFTLDRIHQIRGEQFLQHAASITIKKEGDTLSSWNQQAVKVFEIPGHDNGQLALAPENLAWFIAGDLFQGVGSVVIDPEFGDMDLYLETLERVIAIKPRVLFPSHGMGRGGVHILEKVRDHRLEREQEILALLKEHKNIDEIVATIYHDIPKELIPYAKANVNCHLKRIQKRYTL
jgi:glyoxylase-like metal-dependent hydrolase (beta-lactamase superfamily II)